MGLVLSRRVGERVRIGQDIWVSVETVDRGVVRLNFDAPSEIRILREEIIARQETEEQHAADS